MVKVGEPVQEMSEEERSRKLKEAGMKTIHQESGTYVRPAKDVRKTRQRS